MVIEYIIVFICVKTLTQNLKWVKHDGIENITKKIK